MGAKLGKDDQFRRAWRRGTQLIKEKYEKYGSLDSRVRRGNKGNFIGNAEWSDKATWQKAFEARMEYDKPETRTGAFAKDRDILRIFSGCQCISLRPIQREQHIAVAKICGHPMNRQEPINAHPIIDCHACDTRMSESSVIRYWGVFAANHVSATVYPNHHRDIQVKRAVRRLGLHPAYTHGDPWDPQQESGKDVEDARPNRSDIAVRK